MTFGSEEEVDVVGVVLLDEGKVEKRLVRITH